MNQSTVNIVVAVIVAGILFYLGETNTTLVLIALFGIGYLVFANGLVHA